MGSGLGSENFTICLHLLELTKGIISVYQARPGKLLQQLTAGILKKIMHNSLYDLLDLFLQHLLSKIIFCFSQSLTDMCAVIAADIPVVVFNNIY